jgi:hypothetical protein
MMAWTKKISLSLTLRLEPESLRPETEKLALLILQNNSRVTMILTTEESKTDPEQGRSVLPGLAVLHILESSIQTKAWMKTFAETQLQMRKPKLFGASLKEVLLFTFGNIVTHLTEKIMVQRARDQ